MRIPHPDSGYVSFFFCVAVVSYSSRGSVRIARRPDVGRRAADVPIRVSPGRLARSTHCMAASRPYLYLIYIVDQIACDFHPLAREFFMRAYMRWRMVLLIEVHSMISFFSVVWNNGERNGLSMGFITTVTVPVRVVIPTLWHWCVLVGHVIGEAA
jgi:hypothetical protein